MLERMNEKKEGVDGVIHIEGKREVESPERSEWRVNVWMWRRRNTEIIKEVKEMEVYKKHRKRRKIEDKN